MFDDQTTSNLSGGSSPTPSIGLGINPNPSFVAPPANDPPTPPPTTPIDDVVTDVAQHPAAIAAPGSLEDIKVQALSQLSPLVNQLEQTPEEKYKTLMMMIQASDDQSLISEAYTAAQNISDEKAKAEALLNIVNEINYFTQQSSTS